MQQQQMQQNEMYPQQQHNDDFQPLEKQYDNDRQLPMKPTSPQLPSVQLPAQVPSQTVETSKTASLLGSLAAAAERDTDTN